MDRRPVTRKLAVALGSAVLVLALASCSPFDIVGLVTTQVKLANNKFLLIKASGPFAANDLQVNPGTSIWVQFDRDLDPSSVGAGAATFSSPTAPSVTWTPSYNPSTRTLTIQPTALESLSAYTVEIGSGLRGMDGSSLMANFAVSFTTKQAPSGTMLINSGGAYTQSGTVTLNFTYNFATVQMRWSLTETDLTANYATGISWQTKAASFAGFSLGADGSHTVYYQFIDAANNVTAGYNAIAGTHPLSATVIVDHLPPTGGGTFSVNGGAVYAATTSVALNSTVTDATSPIEMRVRNAYDGGWPDSTSGWQDYNGALPWTVSSPGTRVVNVQFRDKAGNTDPTTYTDAIIAGAPTQSILMNYPHSVGNVTSSWSIIPPDVGTDTYYVSWRYPHGAWSAPYRDTALTGATTLTFPQGTEVILEWGVQIGNLSVGAFNAATATFSNVSPAYTSDVVIVYNDGNSTDTALASTIKSVLKNNPEWKTANGITGTWTPWTVTLIPQSFVSTIYGSYNRIYGYPLIVTPGITNYGVSGWVRNIAASGRGIIAMGDGGARMLDTITANWGVWFKGIGQSPVDIGYAKSALVAANGYLYSRTASGVWSSPLYYSTIYPDLTYYLISNTALTRRSVPRDGTAPTGGFLIATDQNQSYYNTIQQGRFLQFGFNGLPDRLLYAYPWFVNLVARMGAY